MRRLIALLAGIAVGGGAVFAAFQYHLVRTDKTFFVVRRQRADWHDAYVDIRGWSYRDWGSHQELSNDLTSAGRGDLVQRSIGDRLFRGLFDSFRDPAPGSHAPSSPRSP